MNDRSIDATKMSLLIFVTHISYKTYIYIHIYIYIYTYIYIYNTKHITSCTVMYIYVNLYFSMPHTTGSALGPQGS